MPRLLPIALAGFTAILVSSPSHAQMNAAPGAQCRPAVANEFMYHNCRLRIVDGSGVCRCRIAPSAVTRNSVGEQSGRDGMATGSIGRAGSGLAGVSQRSPAEIDGSPAAGGLSAAPGATSGSSPQASSSGVSSREKDNAGIGNGWEASDINDYGGAAAVAGSGINTSRGDPDNPAHGSGTSPGNSGNTGKSAEAPGRTR
jgi:hypothetical protein